MDINKIRKIGRRLRQEIPPLVEKFRGSSPIGKGASGDMTYPLDKKAEEIIFEELEKLNSPLTIVSEEYGFKDIKGGGQRLLIDPIDGSKNVLSGIPFFSTSIALVEGKTIEHTSLGYVINLVNGDEFWAIKGKGSFFNGVPVKTQQNEEYNVIAYEAQTPKIDIPKIVPLLSLFRRARCLGSTAIDMSLLAQGAISMFITPVPSRSFDFASGYLLIKEAGGVITDLKGKEIDKTPVGIEKASPLLASGNEKMHRKALEVLKGFKGSRTQVNYKIRY
jgi:myo-inositol-1(or 4)-monophosphatase